MPLDPTNFHPQGPVNSGDIRQFYDLFTGAMSDQPVTFRNVATVGGNQGITTVPFKIYGAPGQNTNLIDLYPDRSSSQPGFGIGAAGQFGWGPGGTAPQDTFMSRIGNQNGHADNAAGVYFVPGLELLGDAKITGNIVISGAMTAGTIQVTGGGLGTIGATRINFSPTAFVQAYPPDNTFIQVPKLRVTPGATILDGGLTVNGASQVNGSESITGGLTVANGMGLSGTLTISPGNMSLAGALNVGASVSVGTSLYAATTIQSGGRMIANGYDAGPSWGGNFGGNVIASGFFYQRASGNYRCWDNADFTYSVPVAANTLVQRDGSGYVQASFITYTGSDQPGNTRPTHVLGRLGAGDNYLRWWPANAIGPPAVTRYFQSNLQLPGLSNSGGTGDANHNPVYNSLGASLSGSQVVVPYTGYYSIAGGVNGYNQTGNQETMSMTLLSNQRGTLDSLGIPLRITSYFGGYFTWSGILNAGEQITLRFQTSFDSISGGGEMLIAFIPTADYPN
jgi:hypothetical protein